ncbi:MAG: type IV pilus assembly protein FimV [Pseudomonadales bacterium]
MKSAHLFFLVVCGTRSLFVAKAWFALALTLSVWSQTASAAGFGDVRVISSLNEPLRAEIPLLDSAGLDPSSIQIRLADASTLMRMGLEEQTLPDDLELTIEMESPEPRVVVRTRGPMIEPYVALVLELLLPDGKLLKEFTLLIDPPDFSRSEVRTAASAVPAPATSRATAPDPAPAPQSDRWYQMGAAPETLWRIASTHRPAPRISTNQTMLAILRLNPDAFIDGNINRLRALQRLRLPTVEEAEVVSAEEALAMVEAQTAVWAGQPLAKRAVTLADASPGPVQPAPTLAASGEAPLAEEAAEETETAGRLEIVADVAVPDSDNDARAEEAEQLRRELAEARQQAAMALGARDREIDSLKEQVARLKESIRQAEALRAAPQPAPTTAFSNSPLMLGAIILVLALVLAGIFIWRRGRLGPDLGELPASPGATSVSLPVAEPSTRPIVSATDTSVREPQGLESLSSGVPSSPEKTPPASVTPVITQQASRAKSPNASEPSQATITDPGELRLEADDVDALDAETLAREMDLPAPAESRSAVSPHDAVRQLEGAEFDFLDDLDSTATKLDLARAYREMGDTEGAREILTEVLEEGDSAQQQMARDLMATL